MKSKIERQAAAATLALSGRLGAIDLSLLHLDG